MIEKQIKENAKKLANVIDSNKVVKIYKDKKGNLNAYIIKNEQIKLDR